MSIDGNTRVRYAVILPHQSRRKVLAFPSSDRSWVLPFWEMTNPRAWQVIAPINQTVRNLFGIEVTTLRCMDNYTQPDSGLVYRLYELDNHSPQDTPLLGQWIGREDVLQVKPLRHRTLLERWFAEGVEELASSTKEWTRSGWFAEASAWIMAQIEHLALQAISPVEQVRQWERGSILRVRTDKGVLYFKALAPMLAEEIPLTSLLAKWFPQRTVRILAAEQKRHWMLMEDMGGQPLFQISDLSCWKRALQLFADIQVQTSGNVSQLISLGCPERGLRTLVAQIDPFFALLQDHYPALSKNEVHALHVLATRLKTLSEILSTYQIPHSLEHGDLWAGNIMVTDQGYIYFDWTDSSVTHPFFSLTRLLEMEVVPTELLDTPRLRAHFRDAYLEPWTKYASVKRLVEAFELAQKLSPLHHALTYHLHILPQVAAKWEVEQMVPFYLRMLLRFNNCS